MTNKINSIDVSECPLFDKNTGCYHTFNGECVKDSCGVYKWLLEYKRLQEENERLQMLSCANCGEKYLSPDGAELHDINVQLQKENEELKKMLSKEPKAMQAFQTAYSGLKKDNEVLWGMVKDYKTALEEIREITNECITDCMGSKCEGMEKIQNKIDEVLNEN